MGSSHSSPDHEDEVDDDDEVEEKDEEEEKKRRRSRLSRTKEKVLEQEPEILPYGAPATPLSAATTPRLPLAPGVRIWDPTNLLLRPLTPRGFDSGAGDLPETTVVEVFLVNHGECEISLRSDLVGGRWPAAGLTAAGERQVRALAVFLKSQGLRFTAVYASPLVRARASAALVCQELDFPKEQIQFSEALLEMSQGQWEGCLQSEVYSLEMVSLINRTEPDFSAPSGESLREVEFRMIEFLNQRVLKLPEKLRAEPFLHQGEVKGITGYSSTNSVREQDGPDMKPLYRHNRQGLTRKKSGKSRLQFVATGYNEIADESSPREDNRRQLLHEASTGNPTDSIGIFTHATPIKCLLTGLLNCSSMVSHKICIDDSSVTVLQHSVKTGWCIKRLNDTSHLQLL